MIDNEVFKFINLVKQRTYNVPEHMNIRELIHLHDFQKRFIYTNLKRFKYYLKLKVEHEFDPTSDFRDFEKCKFSHIELKKFKSYYFRFFFFGI